MKHKHRAHDKLRQRGSFRRNCNVSLPRMRHGAFASHRTEVAARTPRSQVLVESLAIVAHAKNQVVQIAQSTATLRWEPDGIFAYHCWLKSEVISSPVGLVPTNAQGARNTNGRISHGNLHLRHRSAACCSLPNRIVNEKGRYRPPTR